MRTQVGIVGAGPAGLVLGRLLHLAGINSIIVEQRDRPYVEARVRAGVLEHATVQLLKDIGVGDRLSREGLVHHGVNLQFDGHRHRIALSDLTGGKAITVYGQQEVVKDLIAARLDTGDELRFECTDVRPDGVDTERPTISYRWQERDEQIECDFVAGCDGFHGVCRDTIPARALEIYDKEYPLGWLGILASVPPSTDELIYAYHERGFAMHSLRSPKISRLYLQVDPADDIANWPDNRIWAELQLRLALDGWTLTEGPVLEKGITAMRGFVCEPMQHGRMFLAGDAAHIVPPTGAKGMNLAIADVYVLARAIEQWYRSGDTMGLEGYSEACLQRVWRVQEFSNYMTDLMHRHADGDNFAARVQQSRQRYVCQSIAMSTSLAENYVGLPLPT
jgi:p-hydroxybenzoate 3-monooxygenase